MAFSGLTQRRDSLKIAMLFVLMALFSTGCQPEFWAKKRPRSAALASIAASSNRGNPIQQFGSASSDAATDIALDSSGNVYLCGATTGSFAEANAGQSDVFVMKISAAGSIQWSRQFGNVSVGAAANANDFCNGIVFDDATNSVYIAGYTFGSLGEANAGLPNTDAFVAKLNSSGVIQWISQMGNVTIGAAAANSESVSGIAIFGNGDVVLGGYTDGALGEALGGVHDVFIARFNSAGTFQWVKQLGAATIGAGAASQEWCTSIAVDSADNIAVTGFTLGDLGEVSGGTQDAYVAKFNSAGTLQWVKQLGGATPGINAGFIDFGWRVAFDSNDDIIFAGRTRGPLGEANAGGYDMFVSKINALGVLQWVKQLGNTTVGAGASADDEPYAIVLDSTDNIYLGGYTNGSWGEVSGGQQDAIVVKLDPLGTPQWVRQFGNVTIGAGASSYDFAKGIGLNSSGEVLVGGYTGGAPSSTSMGSDDILYARLNATTGALSY